MKWAEEKVNAVMLSFMINECLKLEITQIAVVQNV